AARSVPRSGANGLPQSLGWTCTPAISHEVQKNHLAEWGRIEDKVEQEVTERTEKGVDNLLRALEERLQLFLAKLLDERASKGPNAVGLGAGVDNPVQDRGGNHLIFVRKFDFQNGSFIVRVIT